MYIIIAITGYFFLALVFILDKLLVSKSKLKPVVMTFYTCILMLVALLALPFFSFPLLSGINWLWAIVSGVAFGLAMWTLFLAVEKGEASHIDPFNGAMVTLFILVLAAVFLGEKLGVWQIYGLLILVLASFLLSFEKSKDYSGFHLGFVWAIISGLLFAVSHVSAKYLYGILPFWPVFIWTRATTGIVGLLLLFSSAVRKTFHQKKNQPQVHIKKHTKLIFGIDKILSVVAIVLIQYAMSLGSVTVVGALSGLQYVLMFVLIYFFTKFFPKVFKEYFTKRELVVETIAIVLVGVGLVMLVI